MKKIVVLLIVLFFSLSCTAADAAQRVGIIIDAHSEFTGADKNIESIVQKTKSIFPAPAYNVLPALETLSATILFCEERGLAEEPPIRNVIPSRIAKKDGITDKETENILVSVTDEEMFFAPSRFDAKTLQELGKRLECDYLFFVHMSRSQSEARAAFMSYSYYSDVFCDTAIFDVSSGKTLYACSYLDALKTLENDGARHYYKGCCAKAMAAITFNQAQLKAAA